jgi:hypothetical protein
MLLLPKATIELFFSCITEVEHVARGDRAEETRVGMTSLFGSLGIFSDPSK